MATSLISSTHTGASAAYRPMVSKHGGAALVVAIGLACFAYQSELARNANDRQMTATANIEGAARHAQTQISEGASESDDEVQKRPTTVLNVLSCTPLPHVAGQSVTTAIVEFPPNAHTSAHRHPGSVTAFVLKGGIRSQMEGEVPQVYAKGATWFEPPHALHVFAENASSTEPAELLAVFVADTNCGALVIPE